MNTNEAVAKKWQDVPKTLEDAKAALALPSCSACVVCNSKMILPVIRPPVKTWLIYCNNCGAEIGFHAVINRKAWRTLANWHNRFMARVSKAQNHS
jgi:transcription elongation factor Elf1